MLTLLQEARLNLDLKKCRFATKEIKYLSYIIKAGVGIRLDPKKIRAIQEQESLTNVQGVRSFLGFSNFYYNIVPNFSNIAIPLYKLTKRRALFQQGEVEEKAFQAIKGVFIIGLALVLQDPKKYTIVEANCLGGALRGCLSQKVNRVQHLVAYYLASLLPIERNYTIYNKELLIVVLCLAAQTAKLQSVA